MLCTKNGVEKDMPGQHYGTMMLIMNRFLWETETFVVNIRTRGPCDASRKVSVSALLSQKRAWRKSRIEV